MAIYNATILTVKNRQLRAAKARVQKKRVKKTILLIDKGFDGQEVLEGQNQSVTCNEARIQVVEPPTLSVLYVCYGMYSICR